MRNEGPKKKLKKGKTERIKLTSQMGSTALETPLFGLLTLKKPTPPSAAGMLAWGEGGMIFFNILDSDPQH